MKKANIVFVHGLWADGSSWNELATLLISEGYEVASVQNPLTSLEDDVAATNRILNRLDEPIVLVGHSWGGAVITATGNHPKVKALVYVAALAPDTDEIIGEITSDHPTEAFTNVEVRDGFLWITKQGVKKHFAQDLQEQKQELIYYAQGPAALNLFEAKLQHPAAWREKPSWYIVATKDETISPELERIMAIRMGAQIYELESSHVPMISQPEKVLEIILEAVKGI